MTNQAYSDESVRAWIADLGSKDGMIRRRARQTLVEKGEPVVDALIEAFQKKSEPLHFEAAKTLSQIGSQQTIQTFIQALEDKEFSVRWMAAEGLIAIGADAIQPLLARLAHHSDTTFLRDGAHHVFHDLVSRKLVDEKTRGVLQSVLDSYRHIEVEVYISGAAQEALDRL